MQKLLLVGWLTTGIGATSALDSELFKTKHNFRYGQHVKTFTDFDARDLLRLNKEDIVQVIDHLNVSKLLDIL